MTSPETTPFISYFSFALALVGTVLGIYNCWRAVVRDKTRLRVVPSAYYRGNEKGIAVTVINDGFYPVQVNLIAFRVSTPGEFLAIRPWFLDDTQLPHYLEARASITAYFSPTAKEHPLFRPVTGAFVRTATGLEFDGTGETFLRYAAELGAASKPSA